jgi:hypothetical protein
MNNKQVAWIVGAIVVVGLAIVLALAARPEPKDTSPLIYPGGGSYSDNWANCEAAGGTWDFVYDVCKWS